MKIIVCLDDRDGMLFNRRRQSKDSALREHLLKMTAGSRLWMNRYSAAQFSDAADKFLVDEAFLEKAGQDDYCFVENADISAYAGSVSGVIIYRWNREYPADVRFPTELFANRWKRENCENFPGNSHEQITQEVYSL